MTTNSFSTLADRIRDEAAQAARPGQMQRLEALADEVARLRRGARTLGETLDFHLMLIKDVTGSDDVIAADGDGDWAVVVERLAAMKAKPTDEATRTDLARVIWETSRADEGTISATGANYVADAVLAWLTNRADPAAPDAAVANEGARK